MTADPSVSKQLLRRTLRDRRTRFVTALPPAVRALAFRRLPTPVLQRLAPGCTVALYHAVGDEAPTEKIAEQLDALGFAVALPRGVDGAGAMHFARWSMEEILVPGPFRTLMPAADAAEVTPDVIIAPLLGYDMRLNRLGQGGGYYDRAFAAHPGALKIGLAWSAQQVDALPAQAHDIPLDMLITEAALFEREHI